MFTAITPVFVCIKVTSSWYIESFVFTGAKYYIPKNDMTRELIVNRGTAGFS